MSVFDMFKTAPAASAPTAPAPASTATTNSAQGNPTVPNNTNTPTQTGTQHDGNANDGKPVAPLGNYEKLWENDPNQKAAEPFSFNSDPQKLMETAKTVDFTRVLTPEIQKRVQAGGADGQQAMMEAMNSVAQLTFAQAAHASSKIVETAVQDMEKRFQDSLPDIIKRHAVAETVRTDNPLITNPAMAPLVEALQQQMTRKFPQATAAEIKAHVNDYLNGAADLITSGRPTPQVKGRKEENWEKFFIPQ